MSDGAYREPGGSLPQDATGERNPLEPPSHRFRGVETPDGVMLEARLVGKNRAVNPFITLVGWVVAILFIVPFVFGRLHSVLGGLDSVEAETLGYWMWSVAAVLVVLMFIVYTVLADDPRDWRVPTEELTVTSSGVAWACTSGAMGPQQRTLELCASMEVVPGTSGPILLLAGDAAAPSDAGVARSLEELRLFEPAARDAPPLTAVERNWLVAQLRAGIDRARRA